MGIDVHLNYVDGEWLEPADGEFGEKHNPARLSEVTGRYPLSSGEDVGRAVRAAREAFEVWSEVSARDRARVMEQVVENFRDRREELARRITLENGKTLDESRGEIDYALKDMDFQIGEGLRLCGETVPVSMPDVRAYSIRQPVGVAAIITPWNFPVNVPAGKCAAALMSGCTVVFKPASLTPGVAELFTELFTDTDLPDGALNLVMGSGSAVGDPLVSDSRIAAVSFTGSTTVGKMIQETAAPNLVRTQLEMGGKNPTIVLEDADHERALDDVVASAFGTTGQKCTATSRLILVEDIADEFTRRLVEATEDLRVGNGLADDVDIGPLCGEDQLDRVTDYIETGREEGAQLLTGGHELTGTEYDDGCFVAPTVFDRVTPDMTIAQEEIFGPVLVVQRVSDFDEAVKVANDVRYGLSASIYTRDLRLADQFVDRIECGVAHVNLMTALNDPQLSFGGWKESGFGIPEAGRTGTKFYTEQKVTYERYAKEGDGK